MTRLMQNSRSGAGGRRLYWEEAAKMIGMVDTPRGLRFIRVPGLVMDEPADCVTDDSTVASGMTSLQTTTNPGRSLVSPQDEQLVTRYLFLLLDQMETCAFTEQDRTGGRSKVKDCPTGFPGLQCKHCAGKAGFGRYFPTSLRALTSANSDRNIHNHIMKCRRCPDAIRQELGQLQNDSTDKMGKNRRGWRKQFFRRVWENLHGTGALPEMEPSSTSSFTADMSSVGGESHIEFTTDDVQGYAEAV